MTRRLGAAWRNAAGITVVEVLIAAVIFIAVVVGLSGMYVVADRHLHSGRSYQGEWSAVHSKLDALLALGYDSLASGSGTVQGYAMSWEVNGTDPKKVLLVVMRRDAASSAVDTFVTYVAKP